MCRYLTHSDDSSIDHQRLSGNAYISEKDAPIKIIYQAGKRVENEINNAHIIFITPKMNNSTTDAIYEVIKEVDAVLVRDFKQMMKKTNNDWYRDIDENSVSSILDLNTQIYKKNDTQWCYSFTPIDDPQGHLSNGWMPINVKKIYEEPTEKDYQDNRDIWGEYGYETDEDDSGDENDDAENEDAENDDDADVENDDEK